MLHEDGYLSWARQIPSTFCDDRPESESISLLVIHNISLPPGEYGGPYVEQLFTGKLDCESHPYFQNLRDLRVSAHFFLRRDGELLQFVSCRQRAWHAGVSSFQGRPRCNDYSIGIEVEGCDGRPYDDRQYDELVVLTRAIMQAYPGITLERITGHQHIAAGRKTDPGPAFDWDRFRRELCRHWSP